MPRRSWSQPMTPDDLGPLGIKSRREALISKRLTVSCLIGMNRKPLALLIENKKEEGALHIWRILLISESTAWSVAEYQYLLEERTSAFFSSIQIPHKLYSPTKLFPTMSSLPPLIMVCYIRDHLAARVMMKELVSHCGPEVLKTTTTDDPAQKDFLEAK